MLYGLSQLGTHWDLQIGSVSSPWVKGKTQIRVIIRRILSIGWIPRDVFL